ncbi:MAG: BON domain-containing protein [Blastocatellia bacterium]
MASEGIFCSECGITLRPFMRVCPRCGAVREEATPMQAVPLESTPASKLSEPEQADTQILADSAASGVRPNGKAKTEVVPLDVARLQRPRQDKGYSIPARDMVFRSPDETHRRFPLFTPAQWTLMTIGAGLLILLLVIAYLLWRQQERDTPQLEVRNAAAAQPTPNASPTLEPSPTPTPSSDQSVYESVKSQLMAYNPLGFSRYSFEVKDGVVTINGEAEHQPEKDGVENVLKLVAGVNSVVNNLKVKPDQPFAPVKLNLAEAKILDDALRREIESRGQAASVDPLHQAQPAPQSRQAQQTDTGSATRERAANKLREEDAAARKAAEEKLRREAEEYERRQEELRQAEATRRARAEQARLEASALRSGTVAWSGVIDGVDEVVITGSSASVRHVNGGPPREVKASFSAPVPRSPVSVTLISTNARGVISVVQQPSAANGYTTIVRVDDSAKGGDRRYEFTLRWSAQ